LILRLFFWYQGKRILITKAAEVQEVSYCQTEFYKNLYRKKADDRISNQKEKQTSPWQTKLRSYLNNLEIFVVMFCLSFAILSLSFSYFLSSLIGWFKAEHSQYWLNKKKISIPKWHCMYIIQKKRSKKFWIMIIKLQ
jgi:hypothetical protein